MDTNEWPWWEVTLLFPAKNEEEAMDLMDEAASVICAGDKNAIKEDHVCERDFVASIKLALELDEDGNEID